MNNGSSGSNLNLTPSLSMDSMMPSKSMAEVEFVFSSTHSRIFSTSDSVNTRPYLLSAMLATPLLLRPLRSRRCRRPRPGLVGHHADVVLHVDRDAPALLG